MFRTRRISGLALGVSPIFSPDQVFGRANNVRQVAAKLDNGAALMADGTVSVWGKNDYGQLADGTTTPYRSAPATVAGSPASPRSRSAASS